jgi:hypothetical protein
MKSLKNESLIIICLILLGCNVQKFDNKAKKVTQRNINPIDGSNIEGHYQAKFITLNPQINGTIPGSANFYRKNNQLYAYVRLFGGGVNAWHIQNVYTGTRCPNSADDINGDGFIDIEEAEKVLGDIIIPLDGNIESQRLGAKRFPYADLSGSYAYERVTSFSKFMNDLNLMDDNLEDNIVKIRSDIGFDFKNLTVLILGIEKDKELPETIATKIPFEKNETFPITCGVYKKIENLPGEEYDENNIPGPFEDDLSETNLSHHLKH